jgi:threonine dehydratase
MTTAESPQLLESFETYAPESDHIAKEVMDRALPLSVFHPTQELYQYFHSVMSIRHIAQHRYEDEQGVVYLQDDTLQESGSFKSRGASNAVMNTPTKDIYGATAGNHGGGLAQACQKLGKRAFISAPFNAAQVKIARMEGFGAQVDTSFASVDAAVPIAESTAEQKHGLFVHPYDNLDVIAGQATAGFDMLQNLLSEHTLEKIDLREDNIEVYVPIGGGGLITGVASVFRWAKDVGYIGENVRIVGVQMENCDAMRRAVENISLDNKPQDLFEDTELNARCDGTAVKNVGALTLPVVADQRYVDRIELVSEGELGLGMYDLRQKLGKRIEPAGALAHAAALRSDAQYRVPMCSGRNVTDETWEHFVGPYDQAVTQLPERALAVLDGYILRETVPTQNESTLTMSSQARRSVMDAYYDSLEDSGLFMQRRY